MLADHPRLPTHNPKATVLSISDWNSLESTVTKIIVDNGVSEPGLTELDLTRFSQLKLLKVGRFSLPFVNELRLIGLKRLKSVVIREGCFTKEKGYRSDPNRHFYLKKCPKLKSLKIGHHSFSDYKVCEIENVNGLEMIEIGDHSFYYSSLELKSVYIISQ